jgi:hypothetical protein
MSARNNQLITAITTDLGNWLNEKNSLYLGIFGESENRAYFNPKPAVVAGRCVLFCRKNRNENRRKIQKSVKKFKR